MAPKAVGKDAAVAYLNSDHPEARDGAGFYEVLKDNEHEAQLDSNGDSQDVKITNTEVKFGDRLVWQKNNPEGPGEPNDPNNNEGKFVYASSVSEPENNGTAADAGGDEG